jgi:hypothetical protein
MFVYLEGIIKAPCLRPLAFGGTNLTGQGLESLVLGSVPRGANLTKAAAAVTF